jgi:hypothetical protein
MMQRERLLSFTTPGSAPPHGDKLAGAVMNAGNVIIIVGAML